MVDGKRGRVHRIRLLVLAGAFFLILLNPFLNFYLQNNFIQGWYQSFGIGNLWFVSPLEGLESLLVTKQIFLPTLIGMLLPICLAALLGSVYCSWICPISFFHELLDLLRQKLTRRKFLKDYFVLPRSTLWYVLIGEILLSLILAAPIFVFLSPPGLVGREIMLAVFFHTLALEGIIILLVLAMNLLCRRFFCRHLCPLGATLNLIGAKRRLQVRKDQEICTDCGLCDRICPLGLTPSSGMADSVYCWNCGECTTVCKPGSLQYHWGPKGNAALQEKDKKQ
ncbi:MAG: 4Fe-4S binding protein [Thermodesulfobacteriota bacterium]